MRVSPGELLSPIVEEYYFMYRRAAHWVGWGLPQVHASESGLSLNARQDYCVPMGEAMVARLILLQPLEHIFFLD